MEKKLKEMLKGYKIEVQNLIIKAVDILRNDYPNLEINLNKFDLNKLRLRFYENLCFYYLNPCQIIKIYLLSKSTLLYTSQMGNLINLYVTDLEEDLRIYTNSNSHSYVLINADFMGGETLVRYFNNNGKMKTKKRSYIKVYETKKGKYVKIDNKRVYINDLPKVKDVYKNEIQSIVEQNEKIKKELFS